jgi:hypothetical protein
MSREANVQSGLQIRKGALLYQGQPTGGSVDVVTATPMGPTPGSVLVATTGTNISLTQLTAMGGLCRIQNQDSNNPVSWGIHDPGTGDTFMVGDCLPGDPPFVFRLSRFLGQYFPSVGTGPAGSGAALRFYATDSPCKVLVEAFDP